MDDKQAIVDDDGNAEGQDVKDVSVKSKIDAIFSSPTYSASSDKCYWYSHPLSVFSIIISGIILEILS